MDDTKTRISQCSRDIAKLQEEKQALEKSLEKSLEKPKLGHGDYGYNDFAEPRVFVLQNGAISAFGHCGLGSGNANSPSYCEADAYTKHGNIFDDLERNSVDLTKFEVSDWYDGDKLEFGIRADGRVSCWHSRQGGADKQINFKIPQLEELHQKSGQMLAYLRRKLKGES